MRGKRRSAGRVIWQTLKSPLGGTSLLILVVLVSMEILFDRIRLYSSTYPATANLLTSFAALAFTGSVVQVVIEDRVADRWREVRDITLKGLNDDLRTARDLLCVATTSQAPFPTDLPEVQEAVKLATASGVDWRSGSQAPALDGIGPLVDSAAWTDLAARILKIATRRMRTGLASWAPLTALARGDHRPLSQAALMADILEAIEFPFHHSRLDESKAVSPTNRGPLCQLWDHASVGFVYVEEEIVRTLHPNRPWTSFARHLLREEAVATLRHWQTKPGSFERETIAWLTVADTSWVPSAQLSTTRSASE
jgi:hypothetical protein